MSSTSTQQMARHPLQRLSSPSRGMSAILHLIGIISFSLSFRYLLEFPTFINASYGWHFQYLTILGLTVAHGTFIAGFLADLTLSPTLFLIKNTLSLCSAPLEVLISVLYWGISAVDKTLVVPPEIHIAPMADIGFHAMPAILLTIDLLLLSPPWTIKTSRALALSSAIAVAYWFWVEECNKHNGFYPYPMFEELSTILRAGVFVGAALLMTGSTVALQKLCALVNGRQPADKSQAPSSFKDE
ncbi:FAR-17a/AIG1-like protein [Cadophora sp. MPI-SDFR-AT-0126]|nr:FAR-17a/AIG1-like protein [Leotiomycetes sp. MPI-SDFR-AT-0126]